MLKFTDKFILLAYNEGTGGVMVIDVGNGGVVKSSNPKRGRFNFYKTLILFENVCIQQVSPKL